MKDAGLITLFTAAVIIVFKFDTPSNLVHTGACPPVYEALGRDEFYTLTWQKGSHAGVYKDCWGRRWAVYIPTGLENETTLSEVTPR